jgi:hypothetical protein
LVTETIGSDATLRNGLLVILRVIDVVITGIFLAIYSYFAAFLWNESIPFIRVLHSIYIALVLASLVYGFVGRRPLVGLLANFVMLGLPLILVLGSV